MTPPRARLICLAIVGLVAGVAVNALYLQNTADRPQWDRPANQVPQAEADPADGTDHARAVNDGITADRNRRLTVAEAPAGEIPAASTTRLHASAAEIDPDQESSGKTDRPRTIDRKSVLAVQRELSRRGYEVGPVDGIIGTMTRAAVMAYEYDKGLPLTARPDDALLKRILFGAPPANRSSASATVQVTTAIARRMIARVQKSLADLRYFKGAATGDLDESTRQAIKSFERDYELAPTGRISGRLIAALSRAGNTPLAMAAGAN